MPFLDVARLLPAALMVYLVHAMGFFAFEPWTKGLVLKVGFVVLSWFFIGSGFVLALRYRDEPWNPGTLFRYFRARILRIVPAYVIGLVLAVLLVSIGVSLFGFPAYFEDVAARTRAYNFALPPQLDNSCIALNALGHLAFLQPFYSQCGGLFLFNPPLWSAAIEVVVYLVFPLSLLCIRRIPARFVFPAAGLVYLLILGFSLLQIPAHLANDWEVISTELHAHPLTRWLEFTMGNLMGLAWNAKTVGFSEKSRSHWWILLAAIGVSLLAFYLDRRLGGELRLRVSFISVTGAVGFNLLLLWLNTARKAKRSEESTYLAFLSYTVYCIHWPYLELLGATGAAAELSRVIGPVFAALAAFIALLALAAIVRQALEPIIERALRAILGPIQAKWISPDGSAARP